MSEYIVSQLVEEYTEVSLDTEGMTEDEIATALFDIASGQRWTTNTITEEYQKI